MNERIKQLADQCMVEVKNVPIKGMDGWTSLETVRQIDPEKFAELIVRECVSLMNTEKEYYSNPGTYESREYYERMSAKKDAFDEAASMIKSHFGVE